MKVQTRVGNTVLEAEGEKHTEVFEQLAQLTEVFGEEKCGMSNDPNIVFRVRQDKDENKYYEMYCPKSKARLAYGCNKKGGGLFPKKRWETLSDTEKANRADEKDYAEKHAGFLPNNGWYIYKPKE